MGSNVAGQQLCLQFRPRVPRGGDEGATKCEQILSMKGHGLHRVCWGAWRLQGVPQAALQVVLRHCPGNVRMGLGGPHTYRLTQATSILLLLARNFLWEKREGFHI